MKRRTISFILVAALLAYAVAGFSGCGKPNSLSAIIVSPLTPVVAKGNTYQLLVTAIFSNRLAVPSWSQVTWSSSAPTVASVSSTGLVSGIETGKAEVTATDIFHPQISHTVTVYVTELDSIRVTPPVASIPTGTTQQFTAIGTYSALTLSSWSTSTTWPDVDITTSVLWTSSSTTIASIGNVLGSSGLATAVSAGTATITATSQTGTLRTGTASLTVF